MRRKKRNNLTLQFLKANGYPLPQIRRAFTKLTYYDHNKLAECAGFSRQMIWHCIAGTRRNREIQEVIAKMWDVDPDELFSDTRKDKEAA